MPDVTRYDEAELMEQVILPIANLKFALETMLEDGQSVDTQQVLRRLGAVQRKASEIHDHLMAPRTGSAHDIGARRLPGILRQFADEEAEEANAETVAS